MKTESLSELIYGGGLILINDANQQLLDLNHQEVIRLFEKHGVILFRNFSVDPKKIKFFTDFYTESYAQDAPRRAHRFDQSVVHDVDPGHHEISLHSEASYSAAWPEIIWFLCLQPAQKGGQTTLCDGVQLWNQLPAEIKNFFLYHPVRYEVVVPIQKSRPGRKQSPWNLGVPGTGEGILNWETGCLRYMQLRSAVHESRLRGKNTFTNHLLIHLNEDSQILSRSLQDGSEIPHNMLNEIRQIAESLTYEIQWQVGDFIMIDNKRLMHGRRAYPIGELRDIAILQTKRASFAYGTTTRDRIELSV